MEFLIFLVFFAFVMVGLFKADSKSSKVSSKSAKTDHAMREAQRASAADGDGNNLQRRSRQKSGMKAIRSENDMNPHRRSDWGERNRPFSIGQFFSRWQPRNFIFAIVFILIILYVTTV